MTSLFTLPFFLWSSHNEDEFPAINRLYKVMVVPINSSNKFGSKFIQMFVYKAVQSSSLLIITLWSRGFCLEFHESIRELLISTQWRQELEGQLW